MIHYIHNIHYITKSKRVKINLSILEKQFLRERDRKREEKRSGNKGYLASIILSIAVHTVLWFEFITKKIPK